MILFFEDVSPTWFKLTVQPPNAGRLVFFGKTREQVNTKWNNYRLNGEYR